MQRIRVWYAKTDLLRYTSNLDMHRVWERTFRRARLPLAYSQGFNPQPRLQQACPLPLGITSQAEIIDAWLNPEQPIELITTALSHSAPPGIQLHQVKNVDLSEPALQTRTRYSEYQATLLEAPADIRQRIQNLLETNSLPRVRRGKSYDLRPLIDQLSFEPASPERSPLLKMRLAAREGFTGRPDEVLLALGIEITAARLERTALILE